MRFLRRLRPQWAPPMRLAASEDRFVVEIPPLGWTHSAAAWRLLACALFGWTLAIGPLAIVLCCEPLAPIGWIALFLVSFCSLIFGLVAATLTWSAMTAAWGTALCVFDDRGLTIVSRFPSLQTFTVVETQFLDTFVTHLYHRRLAQELTLSTAQEQVIRLATGRSEEELLWLEELILVFFEMKREEARA